MSQTQNFNTYFLFLLILYPRFGEPVENNINSSELKFSFKFTQSVYNASVSENSLGSTLVLPTLNYNIYENNSNLMGIWLSLPSLIGKIHYEIISGDSDGLFKLEERRVGIFSFLLIRVGNTDRSLNRELKELHKLKIRAILYQFEVETIINGSSTILENNRLKEPKTEIENKLEEVKIQGESLSDLENELDSSSIHTSSLLPPKRKRKNTKRNPRDEKERRGGGKSREKKRNRKEGAKVPKSSSTSVNQTLGSRSESKVKNRVSTTVRPLAKLNEIRRTECSVLIRVLDMPDNGPLFEQKSYDISVGDDMGLLSKIYKLGAVDADIGRNQETFYSLGEWSPYFSIDPIVGVLSPTRSLVGLGGKRVPLKIIARNRWAHSGPGAETTAVLSIRPSNRHTPQILINLLPKVEFRASGVIYAIVSCRDTDEGLPGLVTLSIKEGDPNGVFSILPSSSPNEFYIVMSSIIATSIEESKKTRLIYTSSSPSFNLTLKAEDFGQPAKSSIKELEVKVPESLWSPPSPPIFDKDVYEVEMSEWSPPGSIVFKFPRPPPGITLSLSSGNEGEEFSLSPSGSLSTSKWLRGEVKGTYSLTVDSLDLRERSRGRMRERSATRVRVRVREENRSGPEFSGGREVEVRENEGAGTLVHKVLARDKDQGENGFVTYSLANVQEIPFTIDAFSGELRTTGPLDFETDRKSYIAIIRASDWGLPYRRESSLILKINLRGVNDNRPLFTTSSCVGVVDRGVGFETEIGRVRALDFDGDRVSYKIVSGNSDSCFSIGEDGELRVVCDLRDLKTSFKRVVNVTATDGEYFSDVISIVIELRDNLKSSSLSKSQFGNSRAGIKLYSTSHSVFECQDTGVVEKYERLLAISEENNRKSGEGEEFTSSSQHENTQPTFIDFPKEVRINESAEVGSRVVRLRGVDKDKGYDSHLTFIISGGDEIGGVFDIFVEKNSNGVQEAFLVISRPLDREEIDSYVLNISLYDMGNPPKSISKPLAIKVLDSNDNAPIFTKSASKMKMLEGNELVGEIIGEIKAFDSDEIGTLNSQISYRLLTHSNTFEIGERSGKIRLLKELDRESVERYELVIVAEDGGRPKLSSTALVTILVEDKNDEAPQFVGTPGRVVRVSEDWPLFSVVSQVEASDRDLGMGGEVRYSVVDGSNGGDLSVDEFSGVVRVRAKLNYERHSVYNLTIQAKDLGTPSLSSTTFLLVEIYDVEKEEGRLSFPSLVLSASVKESAPLSTIVTQIPPPSTSSLYYTLLGPSAHLFNIDSNGVVRTASHLDFETQSQWHYLTVVGSSYNNEVGNRAHLYLVVELVDENDCVPLSVDAMLEGEVRENGEVGEVVLRVEGFDCDGVGNETIEYGLKTESQYFEINKKTGELRTKVGLNRESKSVHSLDITLTDSGSPSLSSSTRLLVRILDSNDNPPFLLLPRPFYSICEKRGGEMEDEGESNWVGVGENEEEGEFIKWSEWGSVEEVPEGMSRVFRVLGLDEDEGENGRVSYRLKYQIGGNGDEIYTIGEDSGIIYTSATSLIGGTVLKFKIQVSDNGISMNGSLTSEKELILRIKKLNHKKSNLPPKVLLEKGHEVSLTTEERGGYNVETLESYDPDGDELWYDIVDGNEEGYFMMFPDSQNLILTKNVPNAKIFNLNISVSEGTDAVYTKMVVKVVDSVQRLFPLQWTSHNYTLFIPESTPLYSLIATVGVVNVSGGVLYGVHNAQDARSLKLFSVDSVSGEIRGTGHFDRETLSTHILTVKGRAEESYGFVRVIVHITDENDRAPVFGAYSQNEIRIPETLAVGSLVTQVSAYDGDSGLNGEIFYSLLYGNIGSTFNLDPFSGRITLSRPLEIPIGENNLEFSLNIKATDRGTPPLSSTTSVNIVVSHPADSHLIQLQCGEIGKKGEIVTSKKGGVKDNKECSCSIFVSEGLRGGGEIGGVKVISGGTSGVSFEVEDRSGSFWVHPTLGVVLLRKDKSLDRETKADYEVRVKATNAQGVSGSCKMSIVLNDINDCIPAFTGNLSYSGTIREDAPLGTLVLFTNKSSPLVLRSLDEDSGLNGIVSYAYIEKDEGMRGVFYMDSASGALLLVTSLDYEKRSVYNFFVRVCDRDFCDSNLADVTVSVENVNDHEPIIFSQTVTLYLPTAPGVLLASVKGIDPDGDTLTYSLIPTSLPVSMGSAYRINSTSGEIEVEETKTIVQGSHTLEISVSDGKFRKIATVHVIVKELEEDRSFGFLNKSFKSSLAENSTKIINLVGLQIRGAKLGEILSFTILNPSPYFGIKRTSGVVYSTGKKLDRETQEKHSLLVEVRGDENIRTSRCFVNIIVTDVNDNAPSWSGNLPYIGVVLLESKPGDFVIRVSAVDRDSNENGLVKYELVRSPLGDIYSLNKETGEIVLRRKPESVGSHELIVKAYDSGSPSLQTETVVEVKILTHEHPVFENQFYEGTVSEGAPKGEFILKLNAISKNTVFYSIESGNEMESFAIGYSSGVLSVNGILDYESTPIHLLKIRGTDLVTTFFSSSTVQIQVKDANDNEPKFILSTFKFSIPENYMPLNGVIGSLVATDKDELLNSALSFEIEPSFKIKKLTKNKKPRSAQIPNLNKIDNNEEFYQNEDPTSNNRSSDVLHYFKLGPTDGVLALREILDYEHSHEYFFSVIVKDGGSPQLSSTARVKISVENVNDNPPIFSRKIYRATISELAPIGHFVTKVSALDIDGQDSLSYSINEYQSGFSIDENSGIVTLSNPSVLLSHLKFHLNVSVTDGVFSSYAQIFIQVQLTNHFVPSFDLSIYEVLAPANSPDGFLITTLKARDDDRSEFGTVSYSFSDSSSLFFIDPSSGAIRSSSSPSSIRTKKSYSLSVVGRDGGNWVGYTQLVVKVEGGRRLPQFPVKEYRVSIPIESVVRGSPIVQVGVEESESELGVHYSLLDSPPSNERENSSLGGSKDSEYFSINAENGDIRFRMSETDISYLVSKNEGRVYSFLAEGREGELFGRVPVLIFLLPSSTPTPTLLPQNSTFFIKEDAPVGHIITTFETQNLKEPKFSIMSPNSNLFQVDESGNLILSSELDKENDKHTVVVWAANGEDEACVATSQVTVRVLSTFSNRPEFSQPEYVLSIAEDFPEGSLVFTARAIDTSISGSIKERYDLQSDDPETDLFHFNINQEHGWIILTNKLDYEKQQKHTLRVIASDSDNPSLTSSTTVIINVLNVDDEPTLFDKSYYYAEIREDAIEKTIVKKLSTVDLDEKFGTNNTITSKYSDFYIVNGDPHSFFKINEVGEISIWKKLDAELIDYFQLTILVTDGYNLDYTNVTIKVIDVNDNVPICPTPSYYEELSESASNSSYITIVEAYDPDKEAKSLLFSLLDNNTSHFKIDSESGILSLSPNGGLDRENISLYSLLVSVKDERDGESECRASITIKLLDENDNPPLFVQNDFRFSVKEDSEVGSFVGKVSAVDSDIGLNSKVKYELNKVITKSGEIAKEQFNIEETSGVILLLRPLDRELVGEYNLTITATDFGMPPLTSSVTVIVNVLDINDHPPQFQFPSYSVSVLESAPLSTPVLSVAATSLDEGLNSVVRYSIIGGNTGNHWAIHPSSGLLSTHSLLDYERVREYVLVVRGTDGGPGEAQLASQVTVNISIVDENDNAPVFSQEAYGVAIPEDRGVGAEVLSVRAIDLDSDERGKVKYRLGYGDQIGNFKIGENDGLITVASVLDREMIPYYTIEVIATDGGVTPLSSTCIVEIQILDINDSPPLFSDQNYTAIVQEDKGVGVKILSFEVNDADGVGNGAPFSWDLRSLEEGEKESPLPFTISHSGELLVGGKLNYLRKNMYRLQATVFDNGTPPLDSTANITIQVVDKSQWPPVVSALSVTVITLDETYPPGILGICHASDFDSFDVLTFSLLKTKSSSFFNIDPLNGTLYNLIRLHEGTYELGIIVSDGRWSARGDAYVKIVALANLLPDFNVEATNIRQSENQQSYRDQKDAKNSVKNQKEMDQLVVLTISGHNRHSLLNRMFALVNVLKDAVAIESSTSTTTPTNSYEVLILSVQTSEKNNGEDNENSTSGGKVIKREIVVEKYEDERKLRDKRKSTSFVDVLLGVRKVSDRTFVTPDELLRKFKFSLPQIEGVLNGKVTKMESNICKNSSCERGTCKTVSLFEGTQSLITTETLSLITPNHKLETLCICPVGYGGAKCEVVVNACAQSDCSSGFICVLDNSEKGYACLCNKINCSPGIPCDDECAQQSVYFSGTSFLSYEVGPSLERELNISFRIKTLYTSGTLLHSFGEFDYALLEINQGLVQFSWDLGTGKEVLTVTSTSVSDNRWHLIHLQLLDSFALLRVNSRSTQKQKSGGGARALHSGGIFHIGSRLLGSPSTPISNLLSGGGFVGCMKDLSFGGVKIKNKDGVFKTQEVRNYVRESGRSSKINDEIGDVGGGHDEDLFLPFHPLPLHFSSPSSVPKLISATNISFTCPKVIHLIESCRSLPCLHGGTCSHSTSPNGYKCSCFPRFTGLNCEIDLEPCGLSPCLNGGKCRPSSVIGGGSGELNYFCNCVDGTSGERCEKGKYCKSTTSSDVESDICNHRGECEDGPEGPICWCEPGFTGPFCQFDYDECEQSEKVCMAGSTCINFLGGFRCLCPSNASGIRCSKVLTTPSLVPNDYQVLFFILIIVLSFIAFLIMLILVRRCYIARERIGSSGQTIPLSSPRLKINQINRDNRDQVMRNRESKISNLEVRPLSVGSDMYQPLPLESSHRNNYDSTEVDKEKTGFINNLIKDKKRGWETNIDDYTKIQNYIKEEINWRTRGSKPSSPDDNREDFNWERGDDDNVPYYNSSILPLPPPPHLSNSHSTIDASSCIPQSSSSQPKYTIKCKETLIDSQPNSNWPILHSDTYLLPHGEMEDEVNENSSLLTIDTKNITVLNANSESKSFNTSQSFKSPRKSSISSSSILPTIKQANSKTTATHITEV